MRILVIGGSDAGISAALRAREPDRSAEITVLLADDFPNWSICGLPYYLGGETPDWRSLAHPTVFEGIDVRRCHRAKSIDIGSRTITAVGPREGCVRLAYDHLVVATGARPVRPDLPGIDLPGVHLLHTMGDAVAVNHLLKGDPLPRSALVVGAGYIGLEMAEAFAHRGTRGHGPEPERPSVPYGGRRVRPSHRAGAAAARCPRARRGGFAGCRCGVHAAASDGARDRWPRDIRRSDTDCRRAAARHRTGRGGRGQQSGQRAQSQWTARCAPTCRTSSRRATASRPGTVCSGALPISRWGPRRINRDAWRAKRWSAAPGCSPGPWARRWSSCSILPSRGLDCSRGRRAEAGFDPITVETESWDHKAYYPGASKLRLRVTGDRPTGRLLGAQILGPLGAEVAKRIDVFAVALFHGMRVEEISDLDLSYAPPFSGPWDPVQAAAQAWAGKIG